MDVYLSEKQRNRARLRFRIKLYFYAALSMGVIVGVFYTIMFSPLFRVREIVVRGNKILSADQITSALESSVTAGSYIKHFLGATNYLVWSKTAPAELFTMLPALSSASITGDYLKKRIIVDVSERQRFGIMCAAEESARKCLWFDRDGTMFETAPAAEGSTVMTINDYSGFNAAVGARILNDPRQIEAASSIFNILQMLGIRIKEMKIMRRELRELIVPTYEGAELRFGLNTDPQQFSEALRKLKNDPGLDKLQYIDMRVENRVYYK